MQPPNTHYYSGFQPNYTTNLQNTTNTQSWGIAGEKTPPYRTTEENYIPLSKRSDNPPLLQRVLKGEAKKTKIAEFPTFFRLKESPEAVLETLEGQIERNILIDTKGLPQENLYKFLKKLASEDPPPYSNMDSFFEFHLSLKSFDCIKEYLPQNGGLLSYFSSSAEPSDEDFVKFKSYFCDKRLQFNNAKKNQRKGQSIELEGKFWDILDIQFQNLAIELLSKVSSDTLKQHARSRWLRHLQVAKNYAVSTRFDIGWDGKRLDRDQQEKKKNELAAYRCSLEQFDWAGLSPAAVQQQVPGFYNTQVSVVQCDTLNMVKQLGDQNDPKKIAYLCMANPIKQSGGLQNLSSNAQEENISGRSNMAGTLAHLSRPDEKDHRLTYQDGCRIPIGGNYIFTARILENEPFESTCILAAFADFRDREDLDTELYDYFIQNSQTSEWQLDPNKFNQYFERIKLDMRGVLRSAKQKDKTILVLGASGCGAFNHIPEYEALAWKQVLEENEFRGHFEQIVFAILADTTRKPDNNHLQVADTTNFQIFKQIFAPLPANYYPPQFGQPSGQHPQMQNSQGYMHQTQNVSNHYQNNQQIRLQIPRFADQQQLSNHCQNLLIPSFNKFCRAKDQDLNTLWLQDIFKFLYQNESAIISALQKLPQGCEHLSLRREDSNTRRLQKFQGLKYNLLITRSGEVLILPGVKQGFPILGKGASRIAFFGMDINNGKMYAIKKSIDALSKQSTRNEFLGEFRILSKLRGCPSIVESKLQSTYQSKFTYVDDKNNTSTVLDVKGLTLDEMCSGTLKDICGNEPGIFELRPSGISSTSNRQNLSGPKLTDVQLQWISLDILFGLMHLKRNNVIHNDIKTANLFTITDLYGHIVGIKYGDFGSSLEVPQNGVVTKTNGLIGMSTPCPDYYFMNQNLTDQNYASSNTPVQGFSYASDVWAAGVALAKLNRIDVPSFITFRTNGDTHVTEMRNFFQNCISEYDRYRNNPPFNSSQFMAYLIWRMMDPNPQYRITCEQAFNIVRYLSVDNGIFNSWHKSRFGTDVGSNDATNFFQQFSSSLDGRRIIAQLQFERSQRMPFPQQGQGQQPSSSGNFGGPRNNGY